MKINKTIGIIGFGNMGSACAEAIFESGYSQVLIYDQEKSKINKIKKFKKAKNIEQLIKASQLLILAIKPQDLTDFIEKNQHFIIQNKPLLVSILAGISIKDIENKLPKVKVVRIMPNLAIRAREGLTFMSKGSLTKKSDLKEVEDIFSLMGQVIKGKESDIDKVTALSGSGPGFIYYFMDSFYKTALKLGFNKKDAKKIVTQTFYGATKLSKDNSQNFSQLLNLVISKGGTTEAGIAAFEKTKLAKSITKGIVTAFEKAKKMPAGKRRGKK